MSREPGKRKGRVTMDPDRRRALEERRRQMNRRREEAERRRAWEERCASVRPFTDSLAAAGEDFRIEDAGADPRWQPRWLPHGSADFLWHLAERSQGVDHEEDDGSRAPAIAAALAEVAGPDDPIVLVAPRYWIAVRLVRAAAERHLAALLACQRAAGSEFWIGHPTADWLIQAESRWTTIFLPPEPAPAPAPVPMADWEMWAIAHHLVAEDAPGAEAKAELFVRANADRGDAEGEALWSEVKTRIVRLLAGGEGETRH